MTFEIYTSRSVTLRKQWRWRLKAKNGRLDVPPTQAPLDFAHLLLSNSEVLRNFSERTVISTDTADLVGSQFRAATALAARRAGKHNRAKPFCRDKTVSLHHILSIFAMSAPEQMVRVHTASIVAGVECEFTIWSRPAIQNQGNVSSENNSALLTKIDDPVAVKVSGGSPFPAIGRHRGVNLRPKSLFHFAGKLCQRLHSHDERSLFECGQGRALRKQRSGPFYCSIFTPLFASKMTASEPLDYRSDMLKIIDKMRSYVPVAEMQERRK